jgi:hypothetical protein
MQTCTALVAPSREVEGSRVGTYTLPPLQCHRRLAWHAVLLRGSDTLLAQRVARLTLPPLVEICPVLAQTLPCKEYCVWPAGVAVVR